MAKLNDKSADFIWNVVENLLALPNVDPLADDGACFLYDATPQDLGYDGMADVNMSLISAAFKEALEGAGLNWWDDPDSPVDEPAVYTDGQTIWFDAAPILAL